MTFEEAKGRLAVIACGRQYTIAYQETENWGYPNILVSITMHVGDVCVMGGTYEYCLASIKARVMKEDVNDQPPNNDHPDKDKEVIF